MAEEKLNKRQREVMGLKLEGKTDKEVAEAMGLSFSSIRKVRENKLFKKKLAELKEEMKMSATEKIEAMSVMASEAMRELLGSYDDKVKFRAAQYILDKNLGKPVSSVDMNVQGTVDTDVTIKIGYDEDDDEDEE